MRRSAWWLVLVVALLVPLSAHAVKVGKILQGTPVFPQPGGLGLPLEALNPGTQVYASDQPKEGYYRVKTPSGKVGWVPASSLSIEGDYQPGARKESGSRATRPKLLRVHGGLNLFNLKEQNDRLTPGLMQNGLGFGGELLVQIKPKLSVALRVEQISKSSILNVTSSGLTYDVSTSSLPVMLGVQMPLWDSGDHRLTAGIYGGLGISTRFTSISTKQASPNTTEYKGSPLTGLARLGYDYSLGSSWLVGAEAGYRYLKLSAAAPSTSGNGVNVYGATTAYPVNLSGPVVGGNVSWVF